MSTISLVDRSAWKAHAPKSVSRLGSTRGVKVHYTGGNVPKGILDDHGVCVEHVQAVQRMHMAGGREVPYADIGYNMVCCPHRKVFMGRGPHVLPAANGPGLNSGHYAVLALVGSTGFTVPNDGVLHAVLDAIDYLREHGGAGKEIKGHRDGYATSCPGEPLYAWIKKGAPRPTPPKPKPEKTWTETLVESLPTLHPGDENWDVKTVRWLMGARGYPPKDLLSKKYDPELKADVVTFKIGEKLPSNGTIDEPTWAALLRR